MKKLPLLTSLLCAAATATPTWKWADLEIVGSRTVAKAEIARAIPLTLGSDYTEDPLQWKQWCEPLKDKFKFAYVECSALKFIDFKAYLIVNVVEKGEEYRLKYRAAPTEDVPVKDSEVFSLYDQLMKRLWALFAQGISAGDNVKEDYLDFTDPEMHALVEKLVEKAPRSRANLIELAGRHKDAQTRAKAAWILCWARQPLDSIARVYPLLDDPDTLVRNDISRFMTHWITRAKPERKLIDALVLQMKRPSHTDRNKALSNLLSYLKANPSLVPYFKAIAKAELDHIAAMSVLPNVGGYAKEIQKF